MDFNVIINRLYDFERQTWLILVSVLDPVNGFELSPQANSYTWTRLGVRVRKVLPVQIAHITLQHIISLYQATWQLTTISMLIGVNNVLSTSHKTIRPTRPAIADTPRPPQSPPAILPVVWLLHRLLVDSLLVPVRTPPPSSARYFLTPTHPGTYTTKVASTTFRTPHHGTSPLTLHHRKRPLVKKRSTDAWFTSYGMRLQPCWLTKPRNGSAGSSFPLIKIDEMQGRFHSCRLLFRANEEIPQFHSMSVL